MVNMNILFTGQIACVSAPDTVNPASRSRERKCTARIYVYTFIYIYTLYR